MTQSPPIEAVSHSWGDDSATANTETSDGGDLKEHIAYLNGKLEALINHNCDLRAEKEEMNKEKQDLRTQLEILTIQCADLKESNAKSNGGFRSEPQEFFNSMATILVETDKKVDRLVAQAEQLKNDLHNQSQEHEKHVEKLTEESSNYLNRLSRYEKNESTVTEGKANAVWRRTMDDVTAGDMFPQNGMMDVLVCPVLSTGIHKWRIRLEREAGVRLGVVSSEHILRYNKELGAQSGSWGYGSHGDAWMHGHKKEIYFAQYGREDAVITLILDLNGDGTLSYAIDHKPAIKVFTSMKSKSAGFIPAAALWDNAKIRFLGFE